LPTPPATRKGELSSPQDRRRYDLLLAGLDLLDQAIAVFDAEPKLVAWTAPQRAADLAAALRSVVPHGFAVTAVGKGPIGQKGNSPRVIKSIGNGLDDDLWRGDGRKQQGERLARGGKRGGGRHLRR